MMSTLLDSWTQRKRIAGRRYYSWQELTAEYGTGLQCVQEYSTIFLKNSAVYCCCPFLIWPLIYGRQDTNVAGWTVSGAVSYAFTKSNVLFSKHIWPQLWYQSNFLLCEALVNLGNTKCKISSQYGSETIHLGVGLGGGGRNYQLCVPFSLFAPFRLMHNTTVSKNNWENN